ncbi:MAG: zinc carboxypeptidase, partial [Bacteroidetes bacterium]
HLGYNVHGNEPSSSEAAMLMAYYLVANQSDQARRFRSEAIVHFDPCINPDGRDRHSHWVNMHKGNPPVADPLDREHTERWPSGRTNHYWFDLNRDWLLAVHPESRAKLHWYHQWMPNVTTDFHEMGTNSTHFFEPMKTNGSKDPIMPRENYTTLNEKFAEYFAAALDEIGSLYFTKEVFDGTYPGYGSSYPDLQGGLGLLFEQASSRGHVQRTSTGQLLTFAFTIRNQLTSSMATMRAAVENKEMMFRYQQDFFRSALANAQKSGITAYVFGDPVDANRNREFIELLLRHHIECYPLETSMEINGQHFDAGTAWVVPTRQPQYRMVQTMFEAYSEYHDSVFYDASAWSPVHFYNIPHQPVSKAVKTGSRIDWETPLVQVGEVPRSSYAYLMSWRDYYAPKALYQFQQAGLQTYVAQKPFATAEKAYGYGTIVIPVKKQQMSEEEVHRIISRVSAETKVAVQGVNTGYSKRGIDLGSRYVSPLQMPRVLMLLGRPVSAYEAGEVWHLLDTKVGMPITKVEMTFFDRVDLHQYDVVILVSGQYSSLGEQGIEKLRTWLNQGGTLITQRTATQWAINQGLVSEQLLSNKEEEEEVKRSDYVEAPEILGARAIGGAIFEIDLDLTHPLGYGYVHRRLPVYRNSNVMLQPSKNPYSTVAQYTENPHISGYISDENLDLLRESAAIVVSPVGRGRAILFSDNPNFRGAWFGTNKLFLNAIFFGAEIRVPR